jgi:hypothetical protein
MGVWLRAGETNQLSVSSFDGGGDGIVIESAFNTVECTARGHDSGWGVTINDRGNKVGALVSGNSNGIQLQSSAEDNYVMTRCSDPIEIQSGAVENIIAGVFPAQTVTDNGTRTVINGYGTNSGNPDSAGEWNGEAQAALNMGVHTVWDVSVDPPLAYEPHPDSGTGVGWRSKNYVAP